MAQIKFPLTLIGISVAICFGYCVYISIAFAGDPSELNARILLLILSLFLSVITSALGIVACCLLARIIGTNFGNLASVSAKLVAGAFFPIAAGLLVFTLVEPISTGFAILASSVLAMMLYFNLLRSLFEMEFFEAIVFILVLCLVFLLVAALLQALLSIQSMTTQSTGRVFLRQASLEYICCTDGGLIASDQRDRSHVGGRRPEGVCLLDHIDVRRRNASRRGCDIDLSRS